MKPDANRYALHFENSIGREAVDAIDTAKVRRWLDAIGSDGQRRQRLALPQRLSLPRRIAQPGSFLTPIAIKTTKSKEVQNFYSAAEMARLDRRPSSALDRRAAAPADEL